MPLARLPPRLAALDTRTAPPPPKAVEQFYRSPEWLALLDEIITERGRRCECPDHDPSRPRVGIRVVGHHIVEIKDGGARLDKRNVMLCCWPCHGRVTADARAQRAAVAAQPPRGV